MNSALIYMYFHLKQYLYVCSPYYYIWVGLHLKPGFLCFEYKTELKAATIDGCVWHCFCFWFGIMDLVKMQVTMKYMSGHAFINRYTDLIYHLTIGTWNITHLLNIILWNTFIFLSSDSLENVKFSENKKWQMSITISQQSAFSYLDLVELV